MKSWTRRSMTDVRGLDVSLTKTGIASSAGWCHVVGMGGITKMALVDKVAAIAALKLEICGFIGHPELLVVEKWAISRLAGGVVERANLQWEIMQYCVQHQIPVLEVSTSQLKIFATGKQGDKGAVIAAVTRRWPQFDTGGDDNACDAIVLCAIGKHMLRDPLAPMPVSHTRALEGLILP